MAFTQNVVPQLQAPGLAGVAVSGPPLGQTIPINNKRFDVPTGWKQARDIYINKVVL